MASDWRFARKPFWIFSHLFAATVIVTFVVLGFWQLARLNARQEANVSIESRISDTLVIEGAPAGDDLNYRSVVVRGRFVDADFVRIGNRSQGGAAGEHVVAIFELNDGSLLAVNRGFVPLNSNVAIDPVPQGRVEVAGWLQESAEKGSFGVTDGGEGTLLPRLDTAKIAERLGEPLPTMWLQVAPSGQSGLVTFPDPVPLPPIDEGPHFGYAMQWFTFAILGLAFYFALLRRQSRGANVTTAVPVEPIAEG